MTESICRDDALIRLLKARYGMPTIAVLEDGSEYIFVNIACGYDLGDEYAHINTNMSPSFEGMDCDFFFTNELVALLDADTGKSLFSFPI
jgi:hypothetical protein